MWFSFVSPYGTRIIGGSPVVFALIGFILISQLMRKSLPRFQLGTWYGNWIVGYAVLGNFSFFPEMLPHLSSTSWRWLLERHSELWRSKEKSCKGESGTLKQNLAGRMVLLNCTACRKMRWWMCLAISGAASGHNFENFVIIGLVKNFSWDRKEKREYQDDKKARGITHPRHSDPGREGA